MNSDGTREEERRERAADLFAEAVARIEGGEEVQLGELGREHPELAEELERLSERWQRLEAGMELLGREGDAEESENAMLEALETVRARSDRYRIGEEVARGGMGAVLEVFDRDLVRVSAMKVVSLESAEGSKGRRIRLARFLREARVTGRLEHPGIVPVHDLGIGEDRRPFFTMPLVRGHDLRAVFKWVHEDRKDWTLPRALGVLLKVCDAVAYAHSRGVLHRDLKPANVMVGRYGEVHVMDWGLAKILGPDSRDPLTDSWAKLPAAEAEDSSPLQTREGDVLGTPSYMPPEQAAGRMESVDSRADVYAIGAMMYHLLGGVAPYADGPGSSSGREVLISVVTHPPTPLARFARGAPPEAIAICERAMERDPTHRYASVEALREDLRALNERRVVSAYERGALAELRKWVRRNRAVALLLAGLIVAVPLLASLATYVAATRGKVLAGEERDRGLRIESALEEGYLELGEGDPERALAHFERALGDDPAALEATAGRVIAMNRLGRYEESLALLDAEAGSGLGHLRATVLQSLGRPEEISAIEDLSAAPSTPLAAFLVGTAELSRGHAGEHAAHVRAADHLERAVQLSRASRPLYLYQLAHALGHLDEDPRARGVAEVIDTLWPEEPTAQFWAGFARTGAGDLDAAQAHFDRAVQARPDNITYRFGLAWSLMDAREFARAEQVLRGMIAEDPEEYSAYLNLSLVLNSKGEYEEAIEAAREAVRLKPERGRTHWGLAMSLYDAGSVHESLPVYREALRLAPELVACRRSYAMALADAGELQEAISLTRLLIEQRPEYAESWAKLALWLGRAGEEEKRDAALQEALRLDPSHASAHVQLGTLRKKAGDLSGAQAHFEAALLGNPEQARVHLALGTIFIARGKDEQAVESLERSVRLDPSLAQAHCNLGLALRALGRHAEALGPLRRGHELGSARADWAYPSDVWIQGTEQLVAAERRLAEAVADPASIASPVQRAELARHALDTERAAEALTLFESALEQQPTMAGDPRHRLLVFAARAAARTASGEGVLPERAAACRERAFEWLEQDLRGIEEGLAAERLDPEFALGALEALQDEGELASIRRQAALSALPVEEGEAWRGYWEAVAQLRAALAIEAGR